MRNFSLPLVALILGISGVHALPTYNDGDVFLGFRDKSAPSSYVVDLGLMDNFLLAKDFSSYLTSTDFGFTASNLNADLTYNLGAGWYNNSNVVWGLFGGYQAGGGSSYTKNGTSLPDNALIVGNISQNVFGNVADQTISGLTGYAAGIGSGVNGVVQNVSSAWYISNSSVGSWASYQYGGPASANNNQGSTAYNWKPFSLETQVGNSLYLNSVYSSDNTQNNGFSGSLLGTFAVGSNGGLTFTTVPEPSTYMLLGIAALIVTFFARKRFSKVS